MNTPSGGWEAARQPVTNGRAGANGPWLEPPNRYLLDLSQLLTEGDITRCRDVKSQNQLIHRKKRVIANKVRVLGA